jgi:predicted nucleic acid-binding protein
LVEWLLPGPRAEEVAGLFQDPAIEMAAPDLILPEAANAFTKAWRAGALSQDLLAGALHNLAELDVVTIDTRSVLVHLPPLLPDLTAYDACYLAVAMSRGAPLATLDRKLAHAAAAREVPVTLSS